MKKQRIVALLRVGLAAVSAAQSGDQRLGLSGIWSGLRTQEPVGACKKQDDGETPAAITLRVEEGGAVTGKDATGKGFSGVIAPDLSVDLTLTGRARCSGDSEPREWTSDYRGKISLTKRGHALLMRGVESPCPPSCAFSVAYALERNK